MPQLLSQNLLRLWPVGLCWLFMMLGDLASSYLMQKGAARSELAITAIIAFFFGQFGLGAILGGLLGRTWLSGWLLAVLLIAVAIAMSFLGALSFAHQDSERIAIVAMSPVLALAACGPLMAMRGLRGWSLTFREQTAGTNQRAGIEDLLLLSIVVACSLSLVRVVSRFSPGFDQTPALVIPAIFFSFSLVFVVPATWVTFRAHNWRQRLLGWTAIAAALSLVLLIMNWFMAPDFWGTFWDTLAYIGVGVVTSTLTMVLGACAMLASGFKLTRFARESGQTLDEDESAELALQHSARRQARWLTGGVVLVTLIVGGLLNLSDYRQQRFLERIQEFGSEGSDAVRSIAIKGDTIVSLAVAHDTTDATFARYTSMRDLERLSLAHSLVTDDIVAELAKFPKLRKLDISDTKFSDSGLERLQKTLKLTELSVAKTRVSLGKAFEAAQSMSLTRLDVSDLGIDDAQLQTVNAKGYLHSLALRGNPITDKGLAELLQSGNQFNELDLSNTEIDGSGLVSGSCPQKLILDGTKITDANLIAILNANPGIHLSIKNTAATAQVLKKAANMGATLALGKGQITERDLANLGSVRLGGLSLNGPEFTGAFLSNGGIQLSWLDLSHSGVTDETFARLKNVGIPYLSSLDLSHTNVTDALFPSLQGLSCYELDLRHTKVTAQGLLRSQLLCGRIIVGHDQFTPAELVALCQRQRVVIDEESTLIPD